MLRVKLQDFAKLSVRVNLVTLAMQRSELTCATSRLNRRAVRVRGGEALCSASAGVCVEPLSLRNEGIVDMEGAFGREVETVSIMGAEAVRDGVDHHTLHARRGNESAAHNSLNQVELAMCHVTPMHLAHHLTEVLHSGGSQERTWRDERGGFGRREREGERIWECA